MPPIFFSTPDDLRRWYAAHHATATELPVGYYKRGTGEPSLTWPESVDESLCVGWIDGIRRSLDDRSYTIRFTPRRKGSIWSAVNIRRAEALSAEGRMQPTGLQAFAARRENRSGVYAYEQRLDRLPEPYAGLLRANPEAWQFFEAQPPSYRRKLSWWIASAKRAETRLLRLEKLAVASAEGRRLD